MADDWRSTIPEEIRGHKSLEHITDVGALAKSYVNAQSMIGADKIAIPGKHATDDDWGEVYRRLGRPDSPEGYELVNEMPEGAEASDDMLNWFRNAAHEAGLTPSKHKSCWAVTISFSALWCKTTTARLSSCAKTQRSS